jgi:hypothetical protein
MPRETSWISAPEVSHKLVISLMKPNFSAKKLLEAYLINSAVFLVFQDPVLINYKKIFVRFKQIEMAIFLNLSGPDPTSVK